MKTVFRALCVFLFLRVLMGFVDENNIKTEITPPHPDVRENKSLTLLCYSTEPPNNTRMTWRLNQRYLKVFRTENQCRTTADPINRTDLYTLRCNEGNNMSLTILNVDRHQHGDTWQCELGFSPSAIVKIFVTVPVQTVTINLTGGHILHENETSLFHCATSYSRPVPIVSWFLNNGTSDFSDDIPIIINTTEKYTNTCIDNDENNTLTSTRSELRYKMQRSMNKQGIYCSAKNILNESSVPSVTETLNITYPPDELPRIRGFGIGETYSVRNNFQGNLSCIVTGGNPLPRLYWNCAYNDSQTTQTYNMTVINSMIWTASIKHARNCTCQSVYQENISEVTINVNVMYPPSTPIFFLQSGNGTKLSVSTAVDIIQNNSFNLACLARSNPNSTYSWTGPGPIESASEILGVHTANRSTEGTYSCNVSNTMEQSNGTISKGQNESSIRLNILYPPKNLRLTLRSLNVGEVELSQVVNVIENDSFNLTCNASGNPLPLIAWTGQINVNSSVLSLQAVKRSKEGNYSCIAKNVMNESTGSKIDGQRNKSIFLSIQYPPGEFTVTLQYTNEITNVSSEVVNVVENDSFNLTCLALSKPEANISWHGKISPSSHIVKIQTIARNMEGNYTCLAVNEMKRTDGSIVLGEQNKTIYLGVQFAPAVENLQDIDVREGSDVNISCKVKPGNPSNTWFRWKRNDDVTEYKTSVLHLTNVSRHDENIYTCIAYNILSPTVGGVREGNNSASFHLNVIYSTTVETFFLEGSQTYGVNQIIEVNQTTEVMLICRVSSNPVSNLTLTFEGGEILHEKSNTNELNHSQILTSCTDTGIYTCTGENNLNSGNPAKAELRIRVRCAPELSKEKHFKQNLTSSISVSVTFSFYGLGYPEPGFKWFKLGGNDWKEIAKDGMFIISSSGQSSNLTVRNVTESEYGLYQLKIENELGVMEKNYTLSPNGKPEPPTAFTVIAESLTETTAVIQWKPGFNGGPEQHFLLRYTHKSSNYSTTINVDDDNRRYINYTVVGLESASTYEIEVFSVNSEGNSRSVFTSFRTKALPETYVGSRNIAGPVTGGFISILIVVFAGILSGIFFYKRRQRKRARNESDGVDLVCKTESPVYENVPKSETVKPMNNKDNKTRKETPMNDFIDVNDTIRAYTQDAECTDPSIHSEEFERVKLSELWLYVSRRSTASFTDDFMQLPSGLQKPCTVARKPENIALNRFNGIYPYDHSRVKICGQDDFFINACYIDSCHVKEHELLKALQSTGTQGYSKEKKYIASFGPTSKTTKGFKTFWQMIWNEGSDIIVMLTSLAEPSGMKCEQYWPKVGIDLELDELCVSCEKVEMFAEYTMRYFTLSNGDETRTLTQLHFTAWPDKKVPEDVTCLLDFRQRVKATPTYSKGPVIVHCSAGIGRTGTFIALDRLIDEGHRDGSVNVLACIKSMREQRVKMVQTPDQYMYIYQALVVSLEFDSDAIPSETFSEFLGTFTNNIYSKQFQQVRQSVEVESKDEKEARVRNGKINKNRHGSDIPGDLNRVKLYLNRGENDLNYINAVYINSFKIKDHFIVAQSPLPSNVLDFLSMIYQEKCSCIVTMEDLTEPGMARDFARIFNGKVGQYVPVENTTLNCGELTVSSSRLETKVQYLVRKLEIKNSAKYVGGELTVYHFQYTKWMSGHDTPLDYSEFLEFVKDVGEFATLGDGNSPVLVHCLNGNERSVLFCAIAILTEKMKIEGQVSVLNTLRHLRTRRRTAIGSMEQLKFCYQALQCLE